MRTVLTICLAALLIGGSADAATERTDPFLTYINAVEYEGVQLIIGETDSIGPSLYDPQIVDVLLSGLSSNAQLTVLIVAAAHPEYRAWLQEQLAPYDTGQGLPVNSERWSLRACFKVLLDEKYPFREAARRNLDRIFGMEDGEKLSVIFIRDAALVSYLRADMEPTKARELYSELHAEVADTSVMLGGTLQAEAAFLFDWQPPSQ
jgi:hypothetical protein